MNDSKLIKTDYIVIGSGLSGLTIANILSKNGLKTIVVDKGNKAGGRMSHGVMNRSKVELNELLERSDVVTLHTPLDRSTHG